MEHIEIERKWLMDGFPELEAEAELWTEQGYLTFSPVVRIRKIQRDGAVAYWLTIKGGGTLTRTEVELQLDAGRYEALRGLLQCPMARKHLRRYVLPGGHILECSLVDEGEPDAFYYAEVEFESEEEAKRFAAPAFFGREVTEEPGYTMADFCRKKAEKRASTAGEK